MFAAIVGLSMLAAAPGDAGASKPGRLDESFAGDGRRLADIAGRSDQVRAVAVAPGRILAGGSARLRGDAPEKPVPAVVCLTRKGALDRTFSHDGRRAIKRLGGVYRSEVGAMLVRAGSTRIFLAGTAVDDVFVGRLRERGSFDRSFADDGLLRIPIEGLPTVEDATLDSHGRMVLVGHTENLATGEVKLFAIRLRRNGELDPTFDEDGVLLTRFAQDAVVRGYGIAIQSDGRIVVGGEIGNNWIVARLLGDGATDPAFGEDGVIYGAPRLVGPARATAIADGRIVAAGTHFGGEGPRFAVARYFTSTAELDPAFGLDGIRYTAFEQDAPSDEVAALVLKDRRPLVFGTKQTSLSGPPARFAIAHYLADGRLNARFGRGGKASIGFPRASGVRHRDLGAALALQPNGRIIVAGTSQPAGSNDDFAVARLFGPR